jgi:hypothetical protein
MILTRVKCIAECFGGHRSRRRLVGNNGKAPNGGIWQHSDKNAHMAVSGKRTIRRVPAVHKQ